MQNLLTCDISLDMMPRLEAWAAHASLRGKSMQEVMRKAMRFAIDFLIAKTKPGNREKIKNDLALLTNEYLDSNINAGRKRLRSAAADQWRGTVAAAIVFRLNYNQARTAALARHPSFYAEVARFVRNRQYATHFHKAGFRPAQRELRGVSAGVKLPTYRKEPTGNPGRIQQKFNSDTVASILVENWATAAEVPGRSDPIGIKGVLGDKIKTVLPELETLFTRFLEEDIIRAAKLAGLQPLS